MGGMQPPSSKKASRSKTDNLNPVIISNALNSTLNRLADMMEKSLDVTVATASNTTTTATASAPTSASSVTPSYIVTPSTDSTQLSSMPSNQSLNLSNLSLSEILDRAIRITTADDGLMEDELLAASIFFISASEDAVHAAQTFIALSTNRVVQHRFLLLQLTSVALLPGRGKNKDDDDHSMMT